MASEVITSRRHKPAMTLVAPKSKDISNTDQAMVALSSLFFVGGVVWAPAMYIWIYKKWKNTPDDKENAKNRKLYRNILIGMMLVGIIGPHRQRKVGEFLNVRNWRIWKAVSFFKYVSKVAFCEINQLKSCFAIILCIMYVLKCV